MHGIIYFLRFQSKIVNLLYIPSKVIERVFWADSPKNPKISVFIFWGFMLPAFEANVLAFKSLGWSPASFFLYRRDIGVPPMNDISIRGFQASTAGYS